MTIHQGGCHCGAIAFTVEGELDKVMDCNCSLCRKRGGLLAFFPRTALTLSTPESACATYTFNRHAIQHHFCPTCGVSPYSDGVHPKTGDKVAAVNVRCLPDVDLSKLTVVPVDGARL